jgi:alpha(1,3/1,4) fucosyltransferase
METEPKIKSYKIGISVFFQNSFFSSGQPTVSITLASVLANLGHTPILINSNATTSWYDDILPLKEKYEHRNLVEWEEKKYEKLDLFIDVDGFLIPNVRRKIAEKVIVFLRKPVALNEMEHSVYMLQGPVRNIKDCDAIWTWAEFGKEDAHLLELMSEKPVFRLPYNWSPHGSEAHSFQLPSWQEASQQSTEWSCHIMETNQSVASSCTMPLVMASYAKKHSVIPFTQCFVHNMDHVKDSQFFKDNILAHSKLSGLNIEMVGRQRIGDWRRQGKSFVLSHMRFQVIKGALLDCIWNGIPVIHNSPWIRDFGHGLERFYYADNSAKGAAKAIQQMAADFVSQSGFFAAGGLDTIRQLLMARFQDKNNLAAWQNAVVMDAPLQPQISQPIVPISPPTPTFTKTELRVGFSDLWQDANCEYNFWTLLLEEACRRLQSPLRVRGIRITEQNLQEHVDLLFYGPFGQTWHSVPASVPKVHITGENTPSQQGNGTYLNLGFDATDKERGIYRFPLWIQYIDWFGADQDRLINPRSMPIDSLIQYDAKELQSKDRFCAFVVSNPTNSIRNAAFEWLSAYKHVDSAGRLFNNIGDAIFTQTGGGGGGELKKMEFLKKYRFCLTYENSRRDGYVTEKLLAAKAAGCVPIYWGARDVTQDFPEGSFLNANYLDSPQDLIQVVKALEENPDAWLAMAKKSILDVPRERRRLSEVARLILEPILGPRVQEIPPFLGATSCAEAKTLGAEREGFKKIQSPSSTNTWNEKILLTTCATKKFIPSLVQWLGSASLHAKANPMISIRVYLGEDVEEHTINLIRAEYPHVSLLRLPTKTVSAPDFSDLWEPQHFAWKIWIYQELVQEEALQGTLVWYSDAGSIHVRMPTEWLEIAGKEGLCMLEDREQKNDQWCHTEFCQRLGVTQEELQAQQVVGGIVSFVAGSPLPWKVFTEAWVYAQQRSVIVGPKWAGRLPDGRPYGHRHDQSILSILRLRHKVPVYPLEKVYNHESLRRTFKSGAALYVHRGNILENQNFAPRIGEVHLINLKRRPDRIQRFKENHEAWTKEVFLRPAFDGRKIKLTPSLARLFAPNDFHWKKAILGCAMSHLSVWLDLANEQSSCENYLILEDDVKFQKGWLQIWEEAAKHIPDDYDVLYLGGVLPPNREMFQRVLEPVNSFWSCVQPNNVFGQNPPTRYFHFCNYAYILSRSGAKKILEGMSMRSGYHTSADHMICNRVQDMKHYILMPQVAGCYQDDDPKYANSSFNDFSRIDGFDSDLWNNDERFSKEEIETALQMADPNVLAIEQAIVDASPAKEIESIPVITPKKQENVSIPSATFYTVGEHRINPSALLEYKWLRQLFGSELENIPVLPLDHEPLKTTPVFLCMKPYWETYIHIFQKYDAMEIPFMAIHLSDEYGSDPIFWYSFKSCQKVFRMYPRKELPCPEKVVLLPLGPNRFTTQTQEIQERKKLWSFLGTKWQDREKCIAPFLQIQPHQCRFFDTWMDAAQLSSEEYSQVCLNSMFMLCPRGQNVETFRFWESLEHGAIPVYVREKGDEAYYEMLSTRLPMLSFDSWERALTFIISLLQNPPSLIQYRKTLLEKWLLWKTELQETCQKVIDSRTSS